MTRTSSGCDAAPSSLSSPSSPNSSLSECLRQSSNDETPTVKSSSPFLGFFSFLVCLADCTFARPTPTHGGRVSSLFIDS